MQLVVPPSQEYLISPALTALAAPYFLTENILDAVVASITFAVTILGVTN